VLYFFSVAVLAIAASALCRTFRKDVDTPVWFSSYPCEQAVRYVCVYAEAECWSCAAPAYVMEATLRCHGVKVSTLCLCVCWLLDWQSIVLFPRQSGGTSTTGARNSALEHAGAREKQPHGSYLEACGRPWPTGMLCAAGKLASVE
jgi:hypothetical protein